MMRRAVSLARLGLGYTSPNPMVGAVIVRGTKVIGEGWHRMVGGPHAEVNAVNSVADKSQLKDATIYVTLEPCSHYGKTPPCSKLIIDSAIPRIVVGSTDPFVKVSGRGIEMLRQAGCDVRVGCLEQECRHLNPVFMTAHSLMRPWVTLKWAMSADGFIDRLRRPDERPQLFSVPLTSTLSHRLRTLHDAILVGSRTMVTDRPMLTVRLWPGRNPRRFVADRRGKMVLPYDKSDGWTRLDQSTISEMLKHLYAEGITSVLVEGGATLLQAFIDSGLWDCARVESAPIMLREGVKAPNISAIPVQSAEIEGNKIDYYGRMPWWMSGL